MCLEKRLVWFWDDTGDGDVMENVVAVLDGDARAEDSRQ